MCKSNIIFWCVSHPSIYSSSYLLNHRAEFNQYCYITYPHGKGLRKQHFFFRPSGVRPTGYHLNRWAESNQTCYMTSPHGKDVEEQVCLSIMLLATLAKFVCVEVLWPSQPNGFMSSVVSLPYHTFTGQA